MVVEGATVTGFVPETTAMLALELILSFLGIGLICWLIFTLAVYALPFFVGLTAGMAALHTGAGILGAFLVGIVVGALTLSAGQVAFAGVKLIPLRVAIAAAFAVPAAMAGYQSVLGLSQIGVPSLFWREVFAWVGAIAIGCTALTRITVLDELPPYGRDGRLRITLRRFSHPQPARDENRAAVSTRAVRDRAIWIVN